MRTTFSVTFVCRKSKQNGRTNLSPVQMVIIINGERKCLNLPWKANADEFNKKRQPLEIQKLQNEWRKKVDNVVAELLATNTPLTTDNLRESLRTGGVKSFTIRDCFTQYLSTQYKRVGVDLTHSAYRKMELAAELFFKYTNPDQEITAVTPAMIADYYVTLNQTYQPNSSASYMAKTKTFIQYAIDNGKLTINPFQNIKVKRERKQIEYLTEKEIQLILHHTFSTEALRRCADCFLVQCYSGLSYIDLENLRKEDIQEDNGTYFIRKNRIKTGVEFTAVIFPEAIPILEKYDYKLPIISNQKTNSALKAIARECGIDKRVYDHLGRKSYGTMLLNRTDKNGHHITIDAVAKCMGHSNSKTTARYYATLHQDTIISEVSKLF